MTEYIDLEIQELSVREDRRGGGVRSDVQVAPGPNPNGMGRLILLLHGFGNTLENARRSYWEFEKNFSMQQPEHANANLPCMYRFYWPGDSKLFKPLYYATYPAEIRPAKKSAEALEKFLRGLTFPPSGLIEVFLIAHSLGNRVVLELVNRFLGGRRKDGLQFKGFLMMAAAVPVAKVRFGGKLHNAATHPERRFVLYSGSDLVLRLAFPLGEILAFDAAPWPWDWPEAIGRHGNPAMNWTHQREMSTESGDGYGHSDYWPGREIHSQVMEFLGMPTPQEPERTRIAINAIQEAPGPAPAAIASRETPTRLRLG